MGFLGGLFKGISSARRTGNNDYDEEYDEDYDESEKLSVWDAADIWASNGFDEDYTFGYSEEELKKALK